MPEKLKELGSFHMCLRNPHRVVKPVGHRVTMFLEAVPWCSTQDQSTLDIRIPSKVKHRNGFHPSRG